MPAVDSAHGPLRSGVRNAGAWMKCAPGWRRALPRGSNGMPCVKQTIGHVTGSEPKVTDHPALPFEIVGDPAALPDEFFEALASLLLSMADECPADEEETT